MYITRTAIPPEWKVEMIAYLAHHVREDGGWGMHLLGETTVFATAPYYVMLRFLGVEVFDPLVARARERLLALGMYYLLHASVQCSLSRRWCNWRASMGKVLALCFESL